MTALELVNQILTKEEFTCTKKQMEFIKKLIEEESNPVLKMESDLKHLKSVIGAIRRDITGHKTQIASQDEMLEFTLKEAAVLNDKINKAKKRKKDQSERA